MSSTSKFTLCFILFFVFLLNSKLLYCEEIDGAKELIENGKMKEAIHILKNMLEDDETNLEVHKYLGVAYFKLGSWIRSRQEFEYLERHDHEQISFLEPYYAKFVEIADKKYKKWEELKDDKPGKAHNKLFAAFRLNPELAKKKKGDMNGALFYWNNKLSEKVSASILYRLGYLNEIDGKISVASDYYAQMLDYVEDNSKIICVIDRYDYLNKTETERFIQAINKFSEKKEEFLQKIKEANLSMEERNQIQDFIDTQEMLARKLEEAESEEEKQEIIQSTIVEYKGKYKNKRIKPSQGLKKFIEEEKAKTGKTKEEVLEEWGLSGLIDEF